MKGLTPAEHEALAYAAGFVREAFANGSPRHLAMLELKEQGRVVPGPSHLPDRPRATGWYITAAGREALRLWPLIKAATEALP